MSLKPHSILIAKLVVAGLVGAVAVTEAAADSIQLKRSIRMPIDKAELTLSDIAILDGEAALALGDVVVFHNPDPSVVHELSLGQLRDVLKQAGIHWGTVHLTGRDVVVRPSPNSGNEPGAMRPASIDHPVVAVPREYREDTFLAAGIVNEATLRGAIALRLVDGLRADPADLRLTFDLADDRALAMGLDEHRFEIDPISSLASDRVQFLIREWVDGQVTWSTSLSVLPLLRVSQAILARDVRRGETLTDDDVNPRQQWLGPAQARLYLHRVEAIGLATTRSLRSGEPLRRNDLRGHTVISRGDRVKVRCVSGRVVITMQAEARGDAAVGETVELRKIGERDTFTATVTQPGEAVIHLGSRP